jgi:hypothetical protein
MAYVPGYRHDVFMSYAHADDRDWVFRFADRLATDLKRLLSPDVTIWIDNDNLRASADFNPEIQRAIESSAAFLLLPSPNYVQSPYCVRQECRIHHQTTLRDRRPRFKADEFLNELFAFRCPILPTANEAHKKLIGNLTDINFFEGISTFEIDAPTFKPRLTSLVGKVYDLLLRMRKQSVPVFVYRPQPSPELNEAFGIVKNELVAQSYRVLPEDFADLPGEITRAAVSVFLLGQVFDETVRELALLVRDQKRRCVVWTSPSADVDQGFLCEELQKIKPLGMTFLDQNVSPIELKETVLEILQPQGQPIAPPSKPSVYLVYNRNCESEHRNARRIRFNFRDEFDFRLADDPSRHAERMTTSDGVLLVWGQAEQNWCVDQFDLMLKSSRQAESKGLCLFDPEEEKRRIVQPIRLQRPEVYIGEQFGQFDARRLDPFFDPIRRGGSGG